MKTAIINTDDISGGAAKAAYRLHKSLREADQESYVVSVNKVSDDNNVLAVAGMHDLQYAKSISLIQNELIDKNRTDLSDTRFSLPYPGVDLSEHEIIREADVINLHWVTQFQSTETISKLLSLNKPVIWTLHDMCPFTGGCHYTAGCENYTADCYDCPQLENNKYQIPYHVLKNKITHFKNSITVVCLNTWMARCARQSTLFKDSRIEIMPNSIETDIYKPFPKEKAKKTLNVSSDTCVLLFGAATARVKRKGFSQLLCSLEICMQDEKFNQLVQEEKIKIIIFGKTGSELEKFSIPLFSAGEIHDDNKIAELYSAADLFILPSLEDNLPNTMLESMACGTPVVAFSVGGIPDVIIDNENGMLAEPENAKALAGKILALVFDKTKRKEMGEQCRKTIEDQYVSGKQSSNYNRLFDQLLKNSKASSPKTESNKNNTCEEIDPYFLKISKHVAIKKRITWLSLLPIRIFSILLRLLKAIK